MVKNVIIENTDTVILNPSSDSVIAGVGLYLCNASPEDDVINVHLIQIGDNPQNKNTIVKDLTIKAGETFEFGYEKLIINDGEQLVVSSENGGRVNATVTYIDIT